jgi:hypothetical protein
VPLQLTLSPLSSIRTENRFSMLPSPFSLKPARSGAGTSCGHCAEIPPDDQAQRIGGLKISIILPSSENHHRVHHGVTMKTIVDRGLDSPPAAWKPRTPPCPDTR